MNFGLKTILPYLIFMVIFISISFVNVSAGEYKLGAGDVISIVVFNEEDFSVPKIRVPKEGKVTFPFVGDIKITGLTIRKLKKFLVKRLKDGYLKKPQLVVNILQYRPFFVNGEVNSPGGYPFVEGLTVRKAIAISGGLTDRASLKKISLVIEGAKKRKKINKSLDVFMMPGDVLTIGEAMF
ncbi:MAG: polysaccharide export protein [Bacteroidetes bacterium]|nr:polysaccharide export protein [Bacteroidota bacterium]